mgnify:CR=1 FL=1
MGLHTFARTSRLTVLLLMTACTGTPTESGVSSSGGSPEGVKVPLSPSTLTASLLGGGAHLTWRDNSANESEFILERKDLGGTFAELTRRGMDSTQFHDEPLAAGQSYVYRVAAANAEGRSTYSNEVTLQVPSPSSSSSREEGSGATSAVNLPSSNGTSSALSAPSSGPAEGSSASGMAPSGSGATSQLGTSSSAAALLNFEDDIIPIFEASCGTGTAGCHSRQEYYATSNRNCRGWLSLENAPLGSQGYDPGTLGQPTGCPDRTLYQRVTQLTAWQCDVPYIVPGDPMGSYIWRKIGGGPYCDAAPGVPSDPMPQVGMLSMQQLETVRTWILLGAPQRP